jgi:hypothetical protein
VIPAKVQPPRQPQPHRDRFDTAVKGMRSAPGIATFQLKIVEVSVLEMGTPSPCNPITMTSDTSIFSCWQISATSLARKHTST